LRPKNQSIIAIYLYFYLNRNYLYRIMMYSIMRSVYFSGWLEAMRQTKLNHKIVPRESGMTLIEVAMGMIIIGLLVTAMLPFYKIYKYDKVRMETIGNLADANRALSQYALVNGGYPPPAPRNLGYEDAGYGVAYSGAIGACVINDPTVCRLNGVSDKDGPAGNDPVLRGDVPFATLGLPYTSSIDGFGNKLTYAVSEYLTVGSAIPFDDNNGVIRVQDESGTFTSTALRNEISNDAHYVIISAGHNSFGAYNKTGVLRSSCDTANAAFGRDRENCDLDSIYTNNFVVYTRPDGVQDFDRVQSDVAGATYYDDYAKFSNNLIAGTWIRSGNSLASGPNFGASSRWAIKVGDQDANDNVVSYYGATASDAPRARLNIVGTDNSLLVSARVNVNRLCDVSTSACNQETHIGDLTTTNIPANVFNPAIIGEDSGGLGGTTYSDSNGIRCGSEQAMKGIRFSEEDCEGNLTVSNPTFINSLKQGAGGCAANTYAQGIDASGNLICVIP
jgi:type II secretory pathway pseudopilin PulG